MKKTSTQKIWNLFLILGIICLGIWWYMEMDSSAPQSIPSIQNPIQENTTPTIPVETTLTMGVVELSVKNLHSMKTFYSEIVGFDIIASGATQIELWENGTTFLRLIEEKDYTVAPLWEAWLYHLAITHNSQKSLANRIKNIITLAPKQYQWSSDHTATEAFYFSDPEGNGLELYFDKPRSKWVYQDGKPVMGSSYIDTMKYIEQYRDAPISGGIATMWHVHLKVGNIAEAESYYRDTLLFEVMKNTGNALFISRDNYHHHLGINTWESLESKKRTKNTYGLRSFELIYHPDVFETIRENLKNTGKTLIEKDSTLITEDPWGNVIIIKKK